MKSANIASEISTKHVAKFDGSNFLGWKFQMNSLFVSHEINDVITGERVMPANRESVEAKTWIKDNVKAICLISSVMEYSQLESLLIYTTAKEMWNNLKLIHEQKSASNKLMLTQQFHAYRIDPTDTVVQHIAKIQNMARRLRDLGETVSDLTIMAKSRQHDLKIQQFSDWDSVEPPRQILKHLKERLIQKENRLGAESDAIIALATTSRKRMATTETRRRA